MPRVIDALARTVALPVDARRIVSLVPSITETLFALGVGCAVVGVTDYCIHPPTARRARVGGPKTVRVERVLALAPDLVVANVEENHRDVVERLAAAGIPVLVTYPRTVDDCVTLIHDLATLTGSVAAAAPMVAALEAARDRARARRPARPPRVLAVIWKDPLRSARGDTFLSSMLEAAGGANVFAAAPERYPRFELDELPRLRPDVIVLATEPYRFTPADRADFAPFAGAVPAVAAGRIHVVDGESLTWYGVRTARGLAALAALLAPPLGSTGATPPE